VYQPQKNTKILLKLKITVLPLFYNTLLKFSSPVKILEPKYQFGAVATRV
jgi:hypothetical protein